MHISFSIQLICKKKKKKRMSLFFKYTYTVYSWLHICTQPQSSVSFTFIGWCTGRTGMMKCGQHESQTTWKPWQCESRLYGDLLSGLQESLPGVFLHWRWCPEHSDRWHDSEVIHVALTVYHRRSPGCQHQWTCRLTNCAASAVPLTHCGDEGSVQIGEQLTVSVWFNTALPGLLH